jgi:hypothetical protein
MGLGGALTAVLHAAPKASGLRATRMLIGRRLLAAGENGPHVIRLLLDGGDRDRAAQAAAADLLAHLDAGPAPELWARIHLVIDWSDDAEFFVAMLRELPQTALARLLELLDQAPGVEPARAQPARAAIGWALTAGSHDRSRR